MKQKKDDPKNTSADNTEEVKGARVLSLEELDEVIRGGGYMGGGGAAACW